ncbi:hypothetical protein ZTR_03183 [Talaromyces verruculosus]|nr:hypothetical protein ZTR_03183 [Talaromyces verruculosus]
MFLTSHGPYLSYSLIVDENRVLQKIPALLNSQTKSVFQKSFEVAGALALYMELKRIMLNTFRHGMEYNAGQTSGPVQTTIINTKEEYGIARETIHQFDLALLAFGHTPDLDNFNEDLSQLKNRSNHQIQVSMLSVGRTTGNDAIFLTSCPL